MDEETFEITSENSQDDSSNSSDEIIELLKSIDDKLTKSSEESTTEEVITEEVTTEEVTTEEVATEEITTESIIYLDDSADTHSYLSTQVENASINDIYTIGLSIRNILLLFFLVLVGMKVFSLLKSMVYRIMNR